jgi:predicted ATP-grasp superfamily ATP-dependent carboligase
VIFKPLQGVGCCGLSAVRNESQVAAAVSKIRKESAGTHFVAQELIKGTATSVSLVSTGSEALGLSLNRQDVTIGAPDASSSYNGGLVPFDSSLSAEAFAVAEKTVKSFRSLRGYVGVDLVLTGEEAVVVEVNPRLTTSYIGLRRVANFNVAQAIVNAVLKGELPANVENDGYEYFSKVETSQPTTDVLQKTYGLKDVASPPFPVSANGKACALVASHGATLNQAMSRFRAAKKRLDSIIGGGS